MPHPERFQILQSLQCPETGLGDHAIATLREEHGFNEIPEKRESSIMVFLSQFQNPMVYILLGAVAISVLVPYLQHGSIHSSELTNAIVILTIVFFNAVLGFTQEWRAGNAIAQLRKLSSSAVKVRRNGVVSLLQSRELLPGDLMIVEAGDRIAADARIVASASAEADESSLTGESVPVAKQALLHVKKSFEFSPGVLYSGTLLTRGSAEAVVLSTGIHTEIGKITSMVMLLRPPATPLQRELKKTGERIGMLVAVLCGIIFVFGLVRGMDPLTLFFTAVSLAVAAVPEGLPAIVTICLAIGVQRMSANRALVRKLDAVETLGSITVICADKTGTMTENRMKVTEYWVSPGQQKEELIQAASSCNRAELPDIGDPTEIALLVFAKQEKIERLPIDDEVVPFTSEAKYMVTTHNRGNSVVRYYKGAPEVIARFTPDSSTEILSRSADLSSLGLRVLAVAKDDGSGMSLLGLIAMMDPPREGVSEAIADAATAGIRTVMITGDHPVTALTIARKVGITTEGCIDGEKLDTLTDSQLKNALKTHAVFARVQPTHKVRILESLQESGEIVAMSGDGVNDAPALRRAHVGVGMGLRGTDVAREAGAIVLTDDNYSTMVLAVAEGRRIYDNIRKFVLYLMRSNIGEVLMVSTALLLGYPMPLLPLHILWINLVTDSFPALALSAEPADPYIMRRKPRKPTDGIFTGEWPFMLGAGALNAAVSLGTFIAVYRNDPLHLPLAQSACLTSTIIFQLFLALGSRSRLPMYLISFFSNPLLLLGVSISISLHLVLLFTPLSNLFGVMPITLDIWRRILIGATTGLFLFELAKTVRLRFGTLSY